MAIKCLNCGYEMSTTVEQTAAVTSALGRLLVGVGAEKRETGARGTLNVLDTKCPRCGARGRWQDKWRNFRS